VAGQVIRALNMEVAYRFAAGKRPAVTPASLSGGTAGNIIPSKAEIRYEIIVRGGEDIETIHRIFHKIPPGIAKIHGASCKVNFYEM
jgi:metal-dependent amidase/aminoacylase/carboxypeptidase family protein